MEPVAPNNEETIDLTSTFPHEQLQDGEHLINTTSDGLSLSAIVKEGKVTWRVTDSQGHEQQLVYIERIADQQSCRICVEYCPAPDRCFVRCWVAPVPCYLIAN